MENQYSPASRFAFQLRFLQKEPWHPGITTPKSTFHLEVRSHQLQDRRETRSHPSQKNSDFFYSTSLMLMMIDRHNCFPSHSNAGSAGSVAGGFQLNARTVLSAVSREAARFILALMSSAAAEAMLATCENSTKTTTEVGLKRRVLSKHSRYRNIRN